MTNFEELVGAEPPSAERDRLLSVHYLLVETGPPPEISRDLEAGPTLAMTLSRWKSGKRRRRPYVLGALAAAILALVIGIGSSVHTGHRYPTISMRGTGFASAASGTLEFLPSKGATQRMRLEVTGLQPFGKSRYVVYLVRNGVRVASCGSFTVKNADGTETVNNLVSPGRYRTGDTWIVAAPTRNGPGPTVLVTNNI